MGLAGSVARLERVHSLRVDGLIASSQHHEPPPSRPPRHPTPRFSRPLCLSGFFSLSLSVSSFCASLSCLLSSLVPSATGCIRSQELSVRPVSRRSNSFAPRIKRASEPALINCPSLFVVPRRKVLPPFRLGLIVEHVVNAIFSALSTEERSRSPLCDNF